MPTYTYSCAECGPMDFYQSIDDKAFTNCPRCDSVFFKKVYGNVGVQFKGKGFYSTDSRGKNGK